MSIFINFLIKYDEKARFQFEPHQYISSELTEVEIFFEAEEQVQNSESIQCSVKREIWSPQKHLRQGNKKKVEMDSEQNGNDKT